MMFDQEFDSTCIIVVGLSVFSARSRSSEASDRSPSHAHNCHSVQEPKNYVAIVAMMHLREQLREYASQANASLHVSIAHAHTLTFFCHSRQEPDHYEGIVAMMRLREQLREYVSQANAVHAATGLPILRPMFIQYPLDPECQTAQVRSPVKRSY
jgi:hypothetical protein